jgi:hypothetical protein
MTGATPSATSPLRARLAEGFTLLRQGRMAEATAMRDALLGSAASDPEVHYFASEVCAASDALEDALAHLLRAIEAAPGQFMLVLKKARVELALRRRDAFRHTAAEAERLAGDDPESLWMLGRAWIACDAPVEAGRLFARARDLGRRDPGLMSDLATTLLFEGRIAEAEDAVAVALEGAPQSGEMLHLRASLRRQTPDANHVVDIERRLEQGITGPRSRAAALYALAREREDIGDYPGAWSALQEGAALKRSTLSGYDVSSEIATIDAIRSAWTPSAIAQVGTGFAGSGAIFVVGMPRTGTTLIERMLDRHPEVRSAGELLDFGRVLAAHARRVLDAGRARTLVDASLHVDFAALGADYTRGAREAALGSPRFIDKLPVNFMYCGIILSALPDARIVHLRRDPMDCVYAVYKTLFNEAYNFSYDFDELAAYYACYRRIMDHWHQLMPGRILEVDYETLVTDSETEARRVLAFCDLDWRSEVVEPAGNPRPSTTASSAQVREAVHSGSVGRWRQYEEGLAPLLRRLAEAGCLNG